MEVSPVSALCFNLEYPADKAALKALRDTGDGIPQNKIKKS
jgi:hypothetical protein